MWEASWWLFGELLLQHTSLPFPLSPFLRVAAANDVSASGLLNGSSLLVVKRGYRSQPMLFFYPVFILFLDLGGGGGGLPFGRVGYVGGQKTPKYNPPTL